MADLGRISGPMLTANLERLGVDLAVETDQLYLNVGLNGTGGVGINTDAFTRTLEVNQYTRTIDLIADRYVSSPIILENNSIATISGPLYLSTTGGSAGTIIVGRNEVDDLFFDDNVIGSKSSNTNIQLDPSGTGEVDFRSDVNVYDDVYVSGNINIVGDLSIGGQIDIGSNPADTVGINPVFSQDLKPNEDARYSLGTVSTRWFNLNLTNYVDLENIKIEQNSIVTKNSNSNLELSGNASGSVQAENIRFVGNTITSTTNDINFNPAIVFDNPTSLVAPVGTTANRSSLAAAEFRYNTTTANFEGFNTARVHFNGVADSDYNTRVFAGATRATDDDTLRFNTNTVQQLVISESSATANRLSVNDQLQIDSAQSKIVTTELNGDVFVRSNGTGNALIESTGFNENTIIADSGNLIFDYAGQGYYKFAGSTAFVIPSGPTLTVIPPSTQVGDFRYNTDTGNLEVFTGVAYGLAQGAGEEVTQSQLDEIIDLYTVIFG